AAGDSVGARTSGYYVTLEARRHSAGGRVALATVLLWAHPAVPDRARSLAELFRRANDVTVTATARPAAGPARLLLPIPPEQSATRELALARGSRVVVVLVLLAVVLALSFAARPIEWYLVLPLVPWLAMRAPIGRAPIGAALGL